MNRLAVLASLLILAACVTNRQQIAQTAATKCPPLGINIMTPDFSQPYKPEEVESFYNCVENEVLNKPNPLITIGLAMQGKPTDDNMKARVAYQKNLWRMIFTGERSKESAQEAWLLWSSNMAYQEALVDVQHRRAKAAEDASLSMRGIPVYDPSQCVGPNIMGTCHGSTIGPPVATCHGTMLNGQCTGPMF